MGGSIGDHRLEVLDGPEAVEVVWRTLRGASPCHLLAGAAVSAFGPGHVPDAPTAVRVCVETVFELGVSGRLPADAEVAFTDAGRLLSSSSRLAGAEGRLVQPFETVLEAFEKAGVGAAGVVEILAAGARPNPLHDAVAQAADQTGGCVLTTNFDRCFELALQVGNDEVWHPGGEPPDPDQHRILKLHGSVGLPGTLRHTLGTVQLGFDDGSRRALRLLTEEPLVVLGYAGADNDVLDVIAPEGAPITWLQLPGRGVPVGARHLAERRRVVVVHVDLGDLVPGVGPYRGSDAAEAREGLHARLRREQTSTLLDVLIPLVFDARVSDAAARDLDHHLATYVEGRTDRSERVEVYLAGRDHDRWAPWSKVRCARRYLRLAADAEPAKAAGFRSEAGDALDCWLVGQGPIVRRWTYRWHRRAVEEGPEGRRGWYRFRAARCAWSRNDRADAMRLVEEALAGGLSSTWEQGNCLRLRAIFRADRGEPWKDDLDRAREMFLFAAQTQAVSNLERSEAICWLLSGEDRGAKEYLRRSRAHHREAGQWAGRLQAQLLLALFAVSPRLLRWLVRRL